MKSLSIEDEPLVAKDLSKLIREIDPSIEIIAQLESLDACRKYFASNASPDLLFMDIQLSDGVSFDLFQTVKIDCPIIFTTAYNEYAIRAFKVNGIDYLLKPIDKAELSIAIARFHKLKESARQDLQQQMQTLFQQIANPGEKPIYKERFTAHSGKSFLVINQSQVACFHKDSLIYLVTGDNNQYITDYNTMEELEELLDPRYFFRANRQHILNIHGVESYRADVYGKLIVKMKAPLSTTIDISREKAQAFKSWLG